MTRNMYTVAGDGPCNEELALRIQAGDKNAAERFVSQNEGYLAELARAYTPWCELEDLKQEAALALLDAAIRFDPAYGTKLLTYATPAIEAALSDYAARHAFPLSVPASRGSQLRTVAYFCAEAQDTSEAELTKAVCEKLKVSSKAAETLLKEYQTTCFFIPLVAPCTPLLIKVVVELFTVFIYDLNTALLWVFNFGLPNRSRLALIFLYRAAAEVRRTSAAVSAAGKGAIPFCAAPRFWGRLIAPIL